MNDRTDAVTGLKVIAERNNTAKQRAVAALIRASGKQPRNDKKEGR